MTSPWPYDLIADFYDEDMGRNNDGRDVAWYVQQATRAAATHRLPVLELGSGTGRITLPLAQAGLDVVALDRSPPMLDVLARKAAAVQVMSVQRLAADMADLPLTGPFSAVLCPYSAFCYLIDEWSRSRALARIRAVLPPGAPLLLDVFIPDPDLDLSSAPPRADYHRPLPAGPWDPATSLIRSRRVTQACATGVNRIERRYGFLDAAGTLLREVSTDSCQRPYGPEDIRTVLEAAGFAQVQIYGDFTEGLKAASPARTATVIAR
jgi:SAM-dependent methyltransferase